MQAAEREGVGIAEVTELLERARIKKARDHERRTAAGLRAVGASAAQVHFEESSDEEEEPPPELLAKQVSSVLAGRF